MSEGPDFDQVAGVLVLVALRITKRSEDEKEESDAHRGLLPCVD